MKYKHLHVNLPSSDYEQILQIVDSGKYINVSDAARHYIRSGLQIDEVKE
ncbi:hypothetical protein [Methanolobus sp.]|nr:hypothetical protein [Methanolobus sp.]